jgi:Xaa-Pro aminopeptidase
VTAPSPVALLKAVRNETEIAGMRAAMHRDGVALVRLLRWIDENVASGKLTEVGVADKLDALRAESDMYRGVSFATIAGYGEHGAIVHYEADEESDVALQAKSFLLLDVGAQYLDGTTDVTRTIPLGELTDEERLDYTLILKGHIDMAMAVFPEGTRGAQLDVLARMPIWQHHMNYLHGTGHGVGHFLNVHEGPQSIRMNENPVVLAEGMLTSNEPGVYKGGKHGIRTENLVLTVPAGDGMFGRYLKFETVTLCPIDTCCITPGILNEDERRWLNDYNRHVYNELRNSLPEADSAWMLKRFKEV